MVRTMPSFMTVTQLADASGYSDKTIQRMLLDGHLRGTRHGERGHWRIDPRSGEAFLQSCNVKAPKPVSRMKRKRRSL